MFRRDFNDPQNENYSLKKETGHVGQSSVYRQGTICETLFCTLQIFEQTVRSMLWQDVSKCLSMSALFKLHLQAQQVFI